MKEKILNLIKRLLYKWSTSQDLLRQQVRESLLEDFIHLHFLPSLPEPETAICYQDFKINLYVTDTGKLPSFNYHIPQRNLFIKLLDRYDCTYEIAKAKGLDELLWKEKSSEINTTKLHFPLTREEKYLIILPWDDEITESYLINKFKEYMT